MLRICADHLIVSFLILFITGLADGQGVCYQRISSSLPSVRYYSTSYINSYSCGWQGWSSCTRVQYRRVSAATTITVYSSTFGCCSGYTQSGSSSCSPVCTGNCNSRGTCVSPNQCNCNSGWTGNDCGTDVDECSSSSTNTCQHICMNTPGSFDCSCNSGYRLNSDGRTCAEIHECNEMTDNCEQVCNNNQGSFFCSCNSGYSLSTNGYSCLNDDECTLGTDSCTQVCHDNPGSYTCSCHNGYMLQSDGFTCNDINECTSGAATCAQTCLNTMGSYTCSCGVGYTLNSNGRTCDDINECSNNNGGCDHTCTNTLGSYNCSCNSGYSLASDQRSCSDINECTLETDNCDQNCINTMGSYSCSCNAGYQLHSNGHTCSDINECADSNSNMCAQVCTNTQGSFLCSCRTGYVLNSDSHSCADVDECLTGNGGCSQICTNTVGTYTCSCNAGYILDSDQRTCNDVNECSTGSVPCTQTCINTPGSYHCTCSSGYMLEEDGFTCTDINECTNESSRCAHICQNVPGSYTCSCNTGYILDANGYSCDDANECGGSHGCEQVCNNTAGSFHCSCFPGYTLATDGLSCQDVDECLAEVDQCEQTCVNTAGSYTCSCNTGYYLSRDGRRCNDINECGPERIGSISCTEVCLNTPGSWQCGCRTGRNLTNDGVTCEDINECSQGLHQCEQLCINTEGSYTCSCNSSTTLNADGFRCDDINECTSDTHNCTLRCYNTYGSFYCGCDQGYMLNDDGVTCEDLNECVDGTSQCEQTCNNTVGSFTCSCNDAFTLTSDGGCLGPPQSITFSQVESSRFLVSWATPVNDSRDGHVQYYTLSCTSRQDKFYHLRTSRGLTNENREFSVRELQPVTDYSCCVSVTTTTGTSPDLCSTQRTLEGEPYTPPDIVGIMSEDPFTISVTVNPPVRANGVIVAYTMYATLDNETSIVVVDQTAAGTLRLRGLHPYQLVRVQVSANTSVGEGPRSSADEIRTQQDVPSAVTGVVISVTSNSSISVLWDPPARANGILLNYTIRIYNRLNNFSKELNASTTGRRVLDVQGLSPYLPYTVEVSALTVVGEGSATTDIVFTEHGVPSVPVLTNAVRISEEQAKIVWIPLTPDEAKGLLTNLRIVYVPTTNGTCLYSSIHNDGMQQMNMSENIDVQTVAIINGLVPSEQYCVAIQVSTIAGESGFSQVFLLSLPSDTLIQMRFSLGESETCQDYLMHNKELKIMDVSSAIVEELLTRCECPYSLDHITNASLICGDNVDEVIYQSNLLNSQDTLAKDLQSMLQAWVNTNPNIQVSGVLQSVNSYCQVGLSALGETDDCTALYPTTVEDQEITEESGSTIIPIIGGVIGGVVFAVLLFLFTGFIWFCWRRKGYKPFITSTKEEDIYEELAMPSKTMNIAYGAHSFVDYTPADYEKAPKLPPIDYEISLKSSEGEADDNNKKYRRRKFSTADFEVSQKDIPECDRNQKSITHVEADQEESQKVPADYEVSLKFSQPNDYEKMYGFKKAAPPTRSLPPADYEVSLKSTQPTDYEKMYGSKMVAAPAKSHPSDSPNDYEKMYGSKLIAPPTQNLPADYEVSLKSTQPDYEKMYGPKQAPPTSEKRPGDRSQSVSKYIPPDYGETPTTSACAPEMYEDMDSNVKTRLISRRNTETKDIKEFVVGNNIYSRIDDFQESDEEVYESMI